MDSIDPPRHVLFSRRQILNGALAAGATGLTGALLSGCGTAAQQASGGGGGGGGATTGGRKAVIKFGYTAVKTNPVAIGYEKFASLIKEQSNGDIDVQTFCCNQLGNDLQLVQSVQSGALQMGTSSNNNLSQVTEAMIALELPYLIRTPEHYRKVWAGAPGDAFRKEFEDKLGMKILMVMDAAGMRGIETSGREVHSPADLKGLKLRVAQTPVELATFTNWGANPVALAYNQVYTALQQHTVDGEVLQPIWFETDKHIEVAQNICDIRYIMLAHIGVINLKLFKSLGKEEQALLEKAAKEAEDHEWAFAAKAVEESYTRLKSDKKIKFFDALKENPDAWTKSSTSVRDSFREKAGATVVKQIEDMA